MFFVALLYAPWAYGCTTAATIIGLNWIIAGTLALWVIERTIFLVAGRVRPDKSDERGDLVLSIPWLLAATCFLLLGIGWWMVVNASAIYDSAFLTFVPLGRVASGLPGSVDRAISMAWMVRATLLLGVTCFVADLTRRPKWLLQLWWAIALTGGSIALLGLIQKASDAPMIFWELTSGPPVTTFFATYYYHANAGAYLNLVFPLTVGLAARLMVTPQPPWVRAIALTMAIAVTVAILANTSRAAQGIGVGLMILVGFLSAKPLKQVVRRAERITIALGVCLTGLAIWAVAQASHLDRPLERWSHISESLSNDARWLASQAALHGLPQAGWFGFGPGTFRVVFPYLTGPLGTRIGGFWRFLHEDYLQTILEWGWIGSALWAFLFFGGMVLALRRMRKSGREWLPRQRTLLSLVLLALTGVALHALVDFPLQIASIQLYVATYLGVCWGATSSWRRSYQLSLSGYQEDQVTTKS